MLSVGKNCCKKLFKHGITQNGGLQLLATINTCSRALYSISIMIAGPANLLSIVLSEFDSIEYLNSIE